MCRKFVSMPLFTFLCSFSVTIFCGVAVCIYCLSADRSLCLFSVHVIIIHVD